MTTSSRLEVASATDPGVVRSFNEDSISIDSDLQLLVLADGMGGYKAGDVASAMATGLIVDDIKRKLGVVKSQAIPKSEQSSVESEVIKAAIEKANRAIYKTAEANNKYHGMGTTVVLALFHNNRVTIAHAGDSRLYRLRHGRFDLLTHDHSLLQEQVELGLISSEEAKVSHNRNLVTRALGVEPEIKVDLIEKNVLPGDVYLLCSDGLNDMVDDTDIELAVSELQSNLALAATQLIQMANDNGGHDNVSVLMAKVVNDIEEERSLSDRLFGWLKKF
ncbi:Stp1/IreP family PP2C-type Ser/Thr phosphatase [Sulfurirhabdus autotrophica]|uniref:Protein phosphatase n=1 Tax=Sulfurirhabdus autotrophica TaxID=1706046 RepID=A0A4R3Y790_9PROT|nr:Stp1/IreP family PP2C-type Ser/Thr phosphatase [Sulfurirhabdus autotrophica]TCV87371.1 protein phosphatase [Sulfurirhabdus autotrophica]